MPVIENISGSSLPFPDSWSELLAVWRSGLRGRRRWFNSHVTLSPWQRRRGASGEGFHSSAHLHAHTDAHTSSVECTHSHACMRGELSHTFFPFTLEAFTPRSLPGTLEESAAAEYGSFKATPMRSRKRLASAARHKSNNVHRDHLSQKYKSKKKNQLFLTWKSYRNTRNISHRNFPV